MVRGQPTARRPWELIGYTNIAKPALGGVAVPIDGPHQQAVDWEEGPLVIGA